MRTSAHRLPRLAESFDAALRRRGGAFSRPETARLGGPRSQRVDSAVVRDCASSFRRPGVAKLPQVFRFPTRRALGKRADAGELALGWEVRPKDVTISF